MINMSKEKGLVYHVLELLDEGIGISIIVLKS